MREHEFLHRHGTEIFELKPGMIVDGAAHDLKVRELKRKYAESLPPLLPEAAAKAKPLPLIARTHQYLFHRKHVARAKTVTQLLALAIVDREIGTQSAKLHTRMLYNNPDLLRDALDHARGSTPSEDESRMFTIYQALAGPQGR